MSFEVNGVIAESFTNSDWICKAYDYVTGELLNSVTTSNHTFTIPLTTSDPVTVVVSPVLLSRWFSGAVVAVDDLYYPSNPKTTPYYFKCITAGTTDTTEPVWNIGTAVITNDGGVVWEMVEEIINPSIAAPLIPSIVI